MSQLAAPAFSGDDHRRLVALEQLVRELMSGRRLEDASIGARGIRLLDGGSLTVEGGKVVLRSPDGVDIAYFGDVVAGDATSRGWIFRFDTGRSAFSLQGSPGDQFWSLRDEAGNIVLSNDGASSTGLARPYLQMWLTPSFAAQQDGTSFWPSTDSGTAVKLMQGINPIWQPRLTIGVAMAGAGGTGHWRLDINGTTVLADETTAGSRTVAIPGWGDTVNPGSAVGIDVYGWVTTGPGRVFLQVDRLHGNQS